LCRWASADRDTGRGDPASRVLAPRRFCRAPGAGEHFLETYTRRMALVPPDSPLRIRADIDARQATQLDSIAFSANVVDFLYGRLAKFLLSVGMTRPITAEEVLADAWAIVDWVHRLDGLVRHLRGVRTGSVVVEDFLNATSLVETQRHRIQHLEGTIPAIEATGRSAFGHLCWTLDGGPTDDGGRRQIIACGRRPLEARERCHGACLNCCHPEDQSTTSRCSQQMARQNSG
jgi:hypothetical protein